MVKALKFVGDGPGGTGWVDGWQVYFLDVSNSLLGIDSDLREAPLLERDEQANHVAEFSCVCVTLYRPLQGAF